MKAAVLIVVSMLAGTFAAATHPTQAIRSPAESTSWRIVLLYDNSKSSAVSFSARPPYGNSLRSELIRATTRTLGAADSVRVASFCGELNLSPLWARTFQEMWAAFETVNQEPCSPSAMWDAIHRASEFLETGQTGRAILMLTDGRASGNVRGFEETLTQVQKGRIIVSIAHVVGRKTERAISELSRGNQNENVERER